MQDVRDARGHEELLDRLVEQVAPALGRESGASPAELRLLLRYYAATGRQQLGAALEAALAGAVDSVAAGQERREDRAAWLLLFAEAASISDDPRLVRCVMLLAEALKRTWSADAAGDVPQNGTRLSLSMSAVDACLIAVDLDESDQGRHLAADAIDELEKQIGRCYQPGSGMNRLGQAAAADALGDHVRSASALLTAYARSGRLPYSMLAEELMQYAMRTAWPVGGQSDAAAGLADPTRDEMFIAACQAVGVLSRMASLHADVEYRAAAVIAQACDYQGEAGLLIDTLGRNLDGRDTESAAEYGLALFDWLSLP